MTRTFGKRGAFAVAALAIPTLALSACGGIEGAGGGETLDLKFASFLGPTTPQGAAFQDVWNEITESDGPVNVEAFWEGSLLGSGEMVAGTADRRADIGYTTIQYNPGELPLTQAVSVPFQTYDYIATTAAYNQLYAENEAFRAEWNDRGVHVLTFAGVPNSIMATSAPLPDYESLAGLQIRSTGFTSNALEAAGANPVSLQIGEVYESLQRGLVSGYTTMILDTVPALSLQEVAPHVTDTGIGQYTMNAVFINLELWESMTDEQRAAIEGAIDDFKTIYVENVVTKEDEACIGLKENGGGVVIWTDDEKQQWVDAVGDTLLDAFIETATASGAEDPRGFFEEFLAATEANASGVESGMARCAAQG